jgi:hypothetical protein
MPMNPLNRLLGAELNDLLDRIATSLPAGSLAAASAAHPTLRARLDEAEARLSAVRATLLEAYGDWGRALEDLENLWALAAWKASETSLAA